MKENASDSATIHRNNVFTTPASSVYSQFSLSRVTETVMFAKMGGCLKYLIFITVKST